jgi:hypothetical protein
MKRSYEDRVRFSGKSRNKAHRPNRNELGFHKTKRHYLAEIEEEFLDREVEEILDNSLLVEED